jgi:hypothetical protein
MRAKPSDLGPLHLPTLPANDSLCLQAIFFAISNRNGPNSLLHLPWWIFLIALLPAPLVVVVQEGMKVHDIQEWDRFQKRTKLQFNTKLGMHSPV